jgi:phosphoglycerate dehydrogenase-like enzyme
MKQPLVYVALAPALLRELELDHELPRLREVAHVEVWEGPGDPTPAAVGAALRHSHVLVTGWGVPPLAELTDWSPEGSPLRLVIHSAGTVKQLVPVEAIERGLLVTHANEALADAVAEFTLGAIILGWRNVFAAAERYRAGAVALPVATQREIRGSTVGVIGASAIGRRVMQLLRPLGARLLLADPYATPTIAAEHGATLVELGELLRESDIVSLHAPVIAETIGMLGAAEFAAMKRGALFVNTARGRLIDDDALLGELQRGRLSALLDVTDPIEPLPLDSPLFRLENCVLLPHMAGISLEARRRQGRIVVDEAIRFLAGEPLQHQVTRARWDTMA